MIFHAGPKIMRIKETHFHAKWQPLVKSALLLAPWFAISIPSDSRQAGGNPTGYEHEVEGMDFKQISMKSSLLTL